MKRFTALIAMLALIAIATPTVYATHGLAARVAAAKAARANVRAAQANAAAAAVHHQAQAVQHVQKVVVQRAVVQKATACTSAACAPAVVHHQAAAVVAAPAIVYPPAVQYFVGAPVRLEAAAARYADALELAEFRSWRRSQAGPPTDNRLPPPPGVQAATAGLLAAKCARCHAGADPAGRLVLDGSKRVALRDFERAASMLASRSGPGEMAATLQQLTEAEAGQLLAELLQLAR